MLFFHFSDREFFYQIGKLMIKPKEASMKILSMSTIRQKNTTILLLLFLFIFTEIIRVNIFDAIISTSVLNILLGIFFVVTIFLFGKLDFSINWEFRDVLFFFLLSTIPSFLYIILCTLNTLLGMFFFFPCLLRSCFILGRALAQIGKVSETKIVIMFILSIILMLGIQFVLIIGFAWLESISPYLIKS